MILESTSSNSTNKIVVVKQEREDDNNVTITANDEMEIRAKSARISENLFLNPILIFIGLLMIVL